MQWQYDSLKWEKLLSSYVVASDLDSADKKNVSNGKAVIYDMYFIQ